jgi:two-component system sensor histidine kinase PrrB
VRLAVRTGLAAAIAAALSLALLGLVYRNRIDDVLLDRVDQQLEARAETAPILAAVGERLAVSELGATVEGARITSDGDVVEVGALPEEPLPPVGAPGWSTARADGQDWRLYTLEVTDVPDVGDRSLVQLVAPLGDADRAAREQRRSGLLVAILATAACGAIGYGFGTIAARPLARLRRDATRVGTSAPVDWRVDDRYGAVEVDQVAEVLNAGLDRITSEVEQREGALESARSFAASAAHELRTPLAGAITNLDVARRGDVDDTERIQLVTDAQRQLRRMSDTLSALRELADADLVDPIWFTSFDLADQVAAVVATEAQRNPDIELAMSSPDGDATVDAWLDGVRLAVSNLVGNAVRHARREGRQPTVLVQVEVTPGVAIVRVDDDGPGIPPAERQRLLRRFERGASSEGSGLGLALVAQVAAGHGGHVRISESDLGGARVELVLPRSPGARSASRES